METMPIYSDFLKKFKHLRQFEPSLGILRFFIVFVCVICCLFYLDYNAMAKRFPISTEFKEFVLLKFNRGSSIVTSYEIRVVVFVDRERERVPSPCVFGVYAIFRQQSFCTLPPNAEEITLVSDFRRRRRPPFGPTMTSPRF
ncbi:Protein trichome birefringence-like 10 [Camellia lanceoleosa]|uniref:Protein trichome birefringence-like 10 n=1 Tax=Camellia lanceoleosa TaxID=1840588 RepID=A0ACC0IC19_9ERIC|nr:Protein trichome birefringence-like 10 [Camellia lanceoleosa]